MVVVVVVEGVGVGVRWKAYQESGQRGDTVLLGNGLSIINVDLEEHDVGVFGGESLKLGTNHTAGAAPLLQVILRGKFRFLNMQIVSHPTKARNLTRSKRCMNRNGGQVAGSGAL